nr:hypothetical protein [Morchella crassipes]
MLGNKRWGRVYLKSVYYVVLPNYIQMHHIRAVKDVKAKITSRTTTFKVWQGALLRKQIPFANIITPCPRPSSNCPWVTPPKGLPMVSYFFFVSGNFVTVSFILLFYY